MPLDGICRFSNKKIKQSSYQVSKIDKLLHPKSIGIAGISMKKMNIGRIILDNVLASGFVPEDLRLIHPKGKSLYGINSYKNIETVPEKMDLLILAVSGSKIPEMIDTIISSKSASSVILISGNIGENDSAGSKEYKDKIEQLRKNNGQEPIFLGSNSLGVLSHPGSYNSLFIPDTKLPIKKEHSKSTALISQSGAYMITRMSKLSFLAPAYAISIGNQLDLTVGDFAHYFINVPEIKTLAFYIEGFCDMDGLHFAKGVQKLVGLDKEVIIYKAGRTPEGKDALSGHTASIAGDYMVCESCVGKAGAMVAETFNIFEGLLRLSSKLWNKQIKGNRLAAISNAGYEAVGIADNIFGDDYRMEMARFKVESDKKLANLLHEAQLDHIASQKNPLDITPMASENTYISAIKILLSDDNVDLLVVAIVPLTPMLQTLADELPAIKEIASNSIIDKLEEINASTTKPLVLVVDSGKLYDHMAEGLESAGLPVFRSADLCIVSLGKYIQARMVAANH